MIEKFKKLFFNDKYVGWLNNFMIKEKEIDNIYFACTTEKELNEIDIEMLEYLKLLYFELKLYYIKNISIDLEDNLQVFCMKYKNNYYMLKYDGDCCYSCTVYDGPLYMTPGETRHYYPNKCFDWLQEFPYVEYEDLKRQYNIEQKAKVSDIETTNLQILISKILNKPSEFYKEICNNLTPEERNFLIKNLENKNCLNCTNGRCRIETSEKIGLEENGKPQGSECIGWFNKELIGKSKVLRITDINKL